MEKFTKKCWRFLNKINYSLIFFEIQRITTAPRVATKILRILKPVTPVPPKNETINPPTKAPRIPKRIFVKQPFFFLGVIIFVESHPAKPPTIIQLKIPK